MVKKVSFILILLVTFGSVLTASAQSIPQTIISTPYVSTTGGPCASLSTTLSYGNHDSTTNGQVSILQNFLYARGYLSVPATGYFGPLTFRAVKAFQSASASGAIDGIVGVQTRAHIFAASCGVNTPVLPIVTGTPTIAPTFAPLQGAVGSTVTIAGSGFSSDSVLHFGVGAISNPTIAADGSSITFTVPSSIGPHCTGNQVCPMYVMLVTNGTYPMYVQNANGTSNTVQFTVINSPAPFPAAQ